MSIGMSTEGSSCFVTEGLEGFVNEVFEVNALLGLSKQSISLYLSVSFAKAFDKVSLTPFLLNPSILF